MPSGECLKDTLKRVLQLWDNDIAPKILSGQKILIVAHGNSLRAIMICVGLYKPEEISKIEIPTGKPFILYYEKNKLIKSKYLI